jgi:Restriction endonuclease
VDAPERPRVSGKAEASLAVGPLAGPPGSRCWIDLVAETLDGHLWAVQAKHYDPAYSIRKADVDSFLSESSRLEFTYRR